MAVSLGRYLAARAHWPTARMMMGIGNITELTDADSGAINVVLLGICEELKIDSVLTTQVIPWARASVRECALARRLVHYAVRHQIPPKHIDPSLVMLRDGTLDTYPDAVLDQMAESIRDSNYRLFAERGVLHLLSAKMHLSDPDPFRLFDQLMATQPKNVDASHAFYLGFEMAKAMTALTLGKNYRQDEALDWGYLTVHEPHHRLARRRGPTASTPKESAETANHASLHDQQPSTPSAIKAGCLTTIPRCAGSVISERSAGE
jgi:dihydropteroate synthase